MAQINRPLRMLAFDTSTTACSVALLNDTQVKTAHVVAPMQQAKLILPLIHDLLAEQDLALTDLDAIAYGRGPGSFTGVRIAASVAQGLGYATSLPLIAVSSLAILAQTAFLERQWEQCLVAVDARTQQIYWGRYAINGSGHMELEGAEQLTSPNEVKIPNNTKWYGIGDGWENYKETWDNRLEGQPLTLGAELLPSAKALLTLAEVKFNQGEVIAPFEAIPVYLR